MKTKDLSPRLKALASENCWEESRMADLKWQIRLLEISHFTWKHLGDVLSSSLVLCLLSSFPCLNQDFITRQWPHNHPPIILLNMLTSSPALSYSFCPYCWFWCCFPHLHLFTSWDMTALNWHKRLMVNFILQGLSWGKGSGMLYTNFIFPWSSDSQNLLHLIPSAGNKLKSRDHGMEPLSGYVCEIGEKLTVQAPLVTPDPFASGRKHFNLGEKREFQEFEKFSSAGKILFPNSDIVLSGWRGHALSCLESGAPYTFQLLHIVGKGQKMTWTTSDSSR